MDPQGNPQWPFNYELFLSFFITKSIKTSLIPSQVDIFLAIYLIFFFHKDRTSVWQNITDSDSNDMDDIYISPFLNRHMQRARLACFSRALTCLGDRLWRSATTMAGEDVSTGLSIPSGFLDGTGLQPCGWPVARSVSVGAPAGSGWASMKVTDRFWSAVGWK